MKHQGDPRGHSAAPSGPSTADVAQAEHGSRAAARSRRDQRGDAGFTLIEMLIAVALMTVIIVPVFSAVRASIAASSRARSAAQVETLIVNIADHVNRAETMCGYSEIVRNVLRIQDWDPGLVTVEEEHFVPNVTTLQPGDGDWEDGPCLIATDTQLLVQRVTIGLSSPDGRANREIQVVKSDV